MTIYYTIRVKSVTLDILHMKIESDRQLPSKSQSGFQVDTYSMALNQSETMTKHQYENQPRL